MIMTMTALLRFCVYHLFHQFFNYIVTIPNFLEEEGLEIKKKQTDQLWASVWNS